MFTHPGIHLCKVLNYKVSYFCQICELGLSPRKQGAAEHPMSPCLRTSPLTREGHQSNPLLGSDTSGALQFLLASLAGEKHAILILGCSLVSEVWHSFGSKGCFRINGNRVDYLPKYKAQADGRWGLAGALAGSVVAFPAWQAALLAHRSSLGALPELGGRRQRCRQTLSLPICFPLVAYARCLEGKHKASSHQTWHPTFFSSPRLSPLLSPWELPSLFKESPLKWGWINPLPQQSQGYAGFRTVPIPLLKPLTPHRQKLLEAGDRSLPRAQVSSDLPHSQHRRHTITDFIPQAIHLEVHFTQAGLRQHHRPGFVRTGWVLPT